MGTLAVQARHNYQCLIAEVYLFAKWSYTVHLVSHGHAILVLTILDIELSKDEFEKSDLVDIELEYGECFLKLAQV